MEDIGNAFDREYVEDNTKKEARKARQEYKEASKEGRQQLRKENPRWETLYDMVEDLEEERDNLNK